MRDYAKVSPTFWTGNTGQALRRRGFEGAYVGAYLMTSPHANMLGLFYQPVLYLAEETGLPLEGAWKGLRDCVAEGFCHYDEATKMVWVVEMAAWQIAKQLKDSDNRCAGIQKDYDGLQNNPFLAAFFDRYQGAFHLKNKRGYEGPSKPLRSQEQEQEQEQERARSKTLPQNPPKATKASPKVKPCPERFAEFWTLYPRKIDKGDAVKAFAKLTEAQAEAAITAIPKHALHWQALGTEQKYIPHAASWLNGQRWEDVFTPVTAKRSRQGAIFETLANDHRHHETAERLAAAEHSGRLLALGSTLPGVRSGTGHDRDDVEVMDGDFQEQGHR